MTQKQLEPKNFLKISAFLDGNGKSQKWQLNLQDKEKTECVWTVQPFAKLSERSKVQNIQSQKGLFYGD